MATQSITFGAFEFLPSTGELRHRGKRVRLQNQSAELLRALLEHPGELVPREDLRRRIWNDGSFTDFEHGLNRAAHRLRLALGDSTRNPRFVETVPRRGYRFIYPLLAQMPEQKKRIGVLPFLTSGNDPQSEYMGPSLAERITFALASHPRLQVMAPSTMRMVADRSPLEAGSALKLDVVLSGRVHPQTAGLQIRLELLETATGALLWGVDRTLIFAEIPVIEKEITESLKAVIFPRQPKGRLPDNAIPEHGAYQDYLKGKHLLNQRTVSGINAALEHFERAVKSDAEFALAYSGLADCYALLSISPYCAVRPRDAMPKAKAAATRALELDPDLAEAYASLGLVKLFYEWDRLSAELLFRRALELNPSYSAAHFWFSLLLASVGRFDEALFRGRYAQEIDPLSPAVHSLIAGVHYFKRDPENALRSLDDPGTSAPRHPLTWCFMGMSYIGIKRFERAVECFERAGGFRSEMTPVLAGMGYASSKAGRSEEVKRIFDLLEQQRSSRYIAPQIYVFLHLGLDEHENALSWLERALEERCDFLVYLDVDAAFDPVRDHRRFIALQRSVREAGSQFSHVQS